MCQTPRVKPSVTFSNKVGLNVWVSLMANRWALVHPGPPWQGSVKFLKQSRPLPWLYWYENFPLTRFFWLNGGRP